MFQIENLNVARTKYGLSGTSPAMPA